MKGYEVQYTVTFRITLDIESENDESADAQAMALEGKLQRSSWPLAIPALDEYIASEVDEMEVDLQDVSEVYDD